MATAANAEDRAAGPAPVAVAKPSSSSHDYKGFVGGVGSGIAKLAGKHSLTCLLYQSNANQASYSWTSLRHSQGPAAELVALPGTS